MNRTLFIVAVVAVLIALAVGIGAIVWQSMRPDAGPSNTGNPFGFTGSSTPVGGQNPGGAATRTVALSDGSTVAIPDIVTTQQQPEWANDDMGYRVAGSAEDDFDILYYPNDSGFSIALLKEPLGQSRLRAEEALRQTLKLSDDQLCKLKSDVGTLRTVSETYAGQELGLSFCPGSVKLP